MVAVVGGSENSRVGLHRKRLCPKNGTPYVEDAASTNDETKWAVSDSEIHIPRVQSRTTWTDLTLLEPVLL